MVAARIIGPLTHWKRYEKERGMSMKNELKAILDRGPLSSNLLECVEKSLSTEGDH